MYLSKRTCTEEDIGYWRKANAIHNWIVKNVQNDNDDCAEYVVNGEALRKLLSVVNEVLEDRTKAPSLLPTQAGFFFGGAEYDDYYFTELENTKEIINTALEAQSNGADIYYSSSW